MGTVSLKLDAYCCGHLFGIVFFMTLDGNLFGCGSEEKGLDLFSVKVFHHFRLVSLDLDPSFPTCTRGGSC